MYAKGTIVYKTKNISIEVIRTPLYAKIKGGIMREVTQSDMIVLDGSESRDLDTPETNNLR